MPKYVLCADDSVTMQKVVAITFANSEYAVTPAKSADEALALARNHKPDLVLADASMPGRSGYDLCQALKADPNTRNVPVVILCGNSSPYDDVKGRQVGADSFLVKPWDTTLFLDKLAEIMGRAQSHGVAAPSHTAPRMPSAPGVAGPHVVSRPPTPVATGPLKGMTAPGAPPPAPHPTPTVMGLPRTVPPGPAAPRPTAPMPPGQAGLPKPPPGLPRPPLIRGAAPGAIRPGAAMPRMTGPLATPPAAPPSPQGTPTPVVAPPSAVTPPATVRPPAPPPPRPSAIRSATIMGMPAVSTPPADPTPTAPRRPEPAAPAPIPTPVARPPVTVIAPKAAPTPSPVVAPRPAPTPPPATVAPRPAPTASPLAATAPAVEPAAVSAQSRGPEYDAIMKLSREIIERIAWEVVPELAEALLRENLSKIQK